MRRISAQVGWQCGPHTADRSHTSRKQALQLFCGSHKDKAVDFLSRMFWVSMNSLASSVPQVRMPDFSLKHTTATLSFFLLASRKSV